MPSGTFTFLGFTFGAQVSWKTGRAYVAPAPAEKKVLGVCDKISKETRRRTTYRTLAEQVQRLNQILMGWGNYFRAGYVTGAWQVVRQHACRRLRRWLRVKQGKGRGRQGPPDLRLYEDYGLVKLVLRIKRIALWANS